MKKLLATALFLLTIAYASGAQTYERASLWEKEIDALTEIDRRQTPPKGAILFIGSSSIRLWKSLRQDFPRLSVINRGFGGSRIEDVNHFFDRIAAPYDVKTIVLYAGENDVNDGLPPERVRDDFVAFRLLVRKSFPKAKLAFISLKPSPSRWKLEAAFRKTNELIKSEISKDKRAVFVDMWPAMLGADGQPRRQLFVADMLHMNEKGYQIWREKLAPLLR